MLIAATADIVITALHMLRLQPVITETARIVQPAPTNPQTPIIQMTAAQATTARTAATADIAMTVLHTYL